MSQPNDHWNVLLSFLCASQGGSLSTSPLSSEVQQSLLAFMAIMEGDSKDEDLNVESHILTEFMSLAAGCVLNEWSSDSQQEKLKSLIERLPQSQNPKQDILNFFFPEGLFGIDDSDAGVERLRKKRAIKIHQLNPQPITNPAKELIFTSNVLLTLPSEKTQDTLSSQFKDALKLVIEEEQLYWFDHPIFMGVERDSNEMIYGLRGLAQMLQFERAKGTVSADDSITVILSLSVTHDGLKEIAHDYLSSELEGIDGLEGLSVYLFTEEDTQTLVQILSPHCSDEECSSLEMVFGLDGRYGRHYSFLKAISPLWQIVMDSEKKGCFKIDLDQVFPQNELVEESGQSAFEHFCTDRWGAKGFDSEGREVELGMIAGALVNEKDIHKGLFTPDVPYPDPAYGTTGERLVFNKQIPMAISTLAEMHTQYEEGTAFDGRNQCIRRVHVTGGTNGILNSSIRKYQPFTPSFIGRAEDQAYILSTFEGGGGLAYVHEPGLIMRHDKEAFAGESIQAAKLDTWVADLLRTLYFSLYAQVLPGGSEAVKESFDPFTGCYINQQPFTMIFLRLFLKVVDEPENGERLMNSALKQLSPFVLGEIDSAKVKEDYEQEKKAWQLFYRLLDDLEANDSDIINIEEQKNLLKESLQSCRIV